MRRILKAVALLVIVIAVAWFSLRSQLTPPPPDHLKERLDSLVSNLVMTDGSVKNCVLAVAKGDGSFSWSGAAGFAQPAGRVPMTRDTPIYIASITKLFTATAVMRLYEKGLLSLNDPMAKYLPASLIRGIDVYHGRDYSNEITIAQLLSHTSGIADYYSERPKGGKNLFEVFLGSPGIRWTVDQLIERLRTYLKPNFPPGAGVSYSDTNYLLLGKVIEAVTGKPLHEVFGEFFFRPLGLDHTWMIGRSKPALPATSAPADVFYKDRDITRMRSNGAYWADGGIVSTAQDMIVFLKALHVGRIVGKQTLKLMYRWHKWRFPLRYGYGTMYFSLPRFALKALHVSPLWGHSGSTGSFLYYSEEKNLYMAGTIDQAASNWKPFELMIKAMRVIP